MVWRNELKVVREKTRESRGVVRCHGFTAMRHGWWSVYLSHKSLLSHEEKEEKKGKRIPWKD